MAWVNLGTIILTDKNWHFSNAIPSTTQVIKITQSAQLGTTNVSPENLIGLRGLLALSENAGGVINYDSFTRIYPSNTPTIVRVWNHTFSNPTIALRINRDRWLNKFNLSWVFMLDYWNAPIVDNPLSNQEWEVIMQ